MVAVVEVLVVVVAAGVMTIKRAKSPEGRPPVVVRRALKKRGPLFCWGEMNCLPRPIMPYLAVYL